MSGDIPYHLSGFQQSGADGGHPFGLIGQQHARGFHPQMHATSQQQQQQNYQRLKVEDALSYLDKVKLQFSNQPEVYNKFLDIMKEFKSQTIDTPGVIERVSRLFQGHSELIVGFNTFLPPGYKIELNTTSDSVSVLFEGKHVQSLGSGGQITRAGPTSSLHSVGASVYDPPHLPLRQQLQSHGHQRHLLDVSNQRSAGSLSSMASNDSGSQPVEFDHAISYVNKIKSRYQAKPEVYKSFLEILHEYQKVQRELKDGITPASSWTEAEVYTKVAELFKDQPDLLTEFGQFLPDAGGNSPMMRNGGSEPPVFGSHSMSAPSSMKKSSGYAQSKINSGGGSSAGGHSGGMMKAGHRRRLSSCLSHNTPSSSIHANKKFKTDMPKDVSLAEAGKYGSLNDFAFFDKIRKLLNNDQHYSDFLRCLRLYTLSVVTGSELMQMVHPFFLKAPEMKKRLKEMVRQRDDPSDSVPTSHSKERTTGEFAMQIDFASCKKYTESYRGVPSTYVPPRCSGRTDLCNEVLNDTIVSFPSWSEDSSSVIKKTMAEEQIFRCEEDRYQLDIVLENVNTTILVLSNVMEKLNNMTTDDQAKFHLDNSLGGRSEYLHRNTIIRLYREHGLSMVESLKRNPAITVPLVLHRLRTKASELREAKRNQQKNWNDLNQKYYMKSLDHQGLNFKQSDTKTLRSKALVLEIETSFEERQDQIQNGNQSVPNGPLMSLTYKCHDIVLDDATSLIIHHMKRQTSIHGDDKRKIKRLLKQFLPSLFFMPLGELSDEEDDMETDEKESEDKISSVRDATTRSPDDKNSQESVAASKVKPASADNRDENSYSLFFTNSNWYVLFRLHYVLCDRLAFFYNRTQQAIAAAKDRPVTDTRDTAFALCLKTPKIVEPDSYYTYFLDMVRNYLDGNMETTAYEEQLRDMFGIHAYVGFTMDKLIQNIVRQLQHLVTETNCVQLMDLHIHEQRVSRQLQASVASSQQRPVSMEQIYLRKAEQLLPVSDFCYKVVVFKKGCRLTIDLLEIDSSNQSDTAEPDDRWTEYMNNYGTDDKSALDADPNFQPLPTYLKRNVRRSMRSGAAAAAVALDAELSGGSDVPPPPPSSDISLMDSAECRFDINSYRRVYVFNRDSFLYRRQSLTIARQLHRKVSVSRHEKFMSLVDKWITKTEADVDACHEFLLGRTINSSEMVPCRTVKEVVSDENVTPYYDYNRYRVRPTSPPRTATTTPSKQ